MHRYMCALRTAGIVLLVAITLPVTGCSTTPVAESDGEVVFYPNPPAPPRLQYLTRLSSQLDVGERNDAFQDFVFGDEGDTTHLVRKPYGLAVHDGAVFVVDTRSNGYAIFDLANGRSQFIRTSGNGLLRKPINITIDLDGNRYVTDTEREQVVVFDASDRFLKAFGMPGQFRPVDVAIVDDKLYVTDILNHRIVVLDKMSGREIQTFGSVGSDPGELFQPTNIAFGPDGKLYVTDTGNFEIDVFSLEGDFVREIGQIGTFAGQFARPKGIAVDRDNRIYVVDAAFENVQILDPSGTPLLYFGGPGNGPGGINLPTVVKVDYDNVALFRRYADPSFDIEYIVLVASQFGANKVAVFGFGSDKLQAASGNRHDQGSGE